MTVTYVLSNTPSPPSIIIDREHEIIQNPPLHGTIFSCDTKKVIAILKELTVDTDVETWMKGKCCGREAMLALQNHYDFKSEGERRR